MIYRKEYTISTNEDAHSAEYGHFDVVWAEYQSGGRGQRGHTWHSVKGENLTFSVVLTPHFLPIVEQFLLSEVVALALVDTLKAYGIVCRIKWTNDIYAADKKIVGVLIEHSLSVERIERTIVGVGINVNQTNFPDDLPNPTSVILECGHEVEREAMLNQFMSNLEVWYRRLEEGDKQGVMQAYREAMYHFGQRHTYAYPSGERFEAVIRDVRPSGELCLEHDDGVVREYAFKEVEFVLPARGR